MQRKTSDLDTHIGLRLRMRRILLNLTQDDLAQRLNITFQQIQKYEKAVNRISASRLYDISQVLNIDISYFFDGYNNDSPSIKKSTVSFGDFGQTPKTKNTLTQKNILTLLMQMPTGEHKKNIFNLIKEQITTINMNL
jgi:transcriptional regulator with XRE-family HTH domain